MAKAKKNHTKVEKSETLGIIDKIDSPVTDSPTADLPQQEGAICVDEKEGVVLIQYTGSNDKEIMDFCNAYHLLCEKESITLFSKGLDKDNVLSDIVLSISKGQFMVKQDGFFRVDN